MQSHLKNFLSETSAHGFSRLLPRGFNDGPSRILWAAAILFSFSASFYLTISSVEEAKDNPIATNIEFVPVQEVLFPAVTLEADTMKYFPLKRAIMDQLTYDCTNPSTTGKDNEDCVEQSASVRRIIQPVAASFLRSVYIKYQEVILFYETKSTNNGYLINLICSYAAYDTAPEFAPFLSPLIFSLSSRRVNSTVRAQRVDQYLERIASLLKTPVHYFAAKMTQLMEEEQHSFKMYFQSCHAVYYSSFISLDATAVSLLIIKLLNDDTRMTFSGWNNLIYLGVIGGSAYNKYSNISKSLKFDVAEGMRSIVAKNSMMFDDILVFLGQADPDMGFNRSSVMSVDIASIQKNYRDILRVAKYKIKPLNIQMDEVAKINDLQSRSMELIDPQYGRSNPDSYTNHFPAVLYCNFRRETDNMCHNSVVTFTTSGLGHSFNTKGFFELYQKKSSLDLFYKEMVERNGKNTPDNYGLNKDLISVKKNGPGFAFRLLLLSPQYSKHKWLLQRLALHSPHTIPDLTGNFIEPVAGTHTTIVATPHVTVTDDGLLEQDLSSRRCLSTEVDPNPLALFNTYTRDNCIFECHVNKTKDTCGCIPWYFPKLDLEDNTCSKNESTCFIEQMEDYQDSLECTHCIDECWKVDYDYTLHTKPFKNICDDSKEIRDNVNVVVNEYSGLANFLPELDVLQDMGIDYHLMDACFVFAKKNVALVDIHVGPKTVVKITRRARVTFLQQLANLGGMVALFTGMSILTVFELVMWLLEIPLAIRARK